MFNIFTRKAPAQRPVSNNDMSTIGNYEHVKDLTQGGGGITSLIRHKVSSKVVVYKKMANPIRDGQYSTPLEVHALVNILHYPQHSNIGRLLMFEAVKDVSHLLLEYYQGGDLLDYSHALYWQDKRAPTPPIFMLHFTIQMANALAFLHHNLPATDCSEIFPTHQSLIHGDIKLENIFLEFRTTHPAGLPDIILGDFGCAMSESDSMGWCGTVGYLAPEVDEYRLALVADPELNSEKAVTPKADIYSLGVCLWRLGTKVWRMQSQNEQRIPTGRDMIFQINSGGLGVPDMADFVTLMKECLAKDPNDRPEAVHLRRATPRLQAQLDKRVRNGEKMPSLP